MHSALSTKPSFCRIPNILPTKVPSTSLLLVASQQVYVLLIIISTHNGDDVPSQKIYSRLLSKSGTEVWPAGDSIAFVEYECKASNQLYCVSCLLQHTEVYLSYNDKSTTRGYVWMRSAPSVILNSCVGDKICSSLTYTADRAPLERPDELRQWTVETVGLLESDK